MFAHPVLVADIGGTNSRFSIVETPGQDPRILGRFRTADYPGPLEAIQAALALTPLKPQSVVMCVAGPVVDRRCHLTNARWTIDGPALAKALGLTSGLLLNDFEAQALSLPALHPEWLKQIGEAAPSKGGSMQVILGPGTGLGIGALLTLDGRYVPLASESCHVDLGPVDKDGEKFWPHLQKVMDRHTTESVMSGPGLVRIHRARMIAKGLQPSTDDGVAIVNAALADPASDARATINAYLKIIARFAGDIAITFLASGGVTLAGGILPRIASMIDGAAFRRAFEMKAPVDALTRRISTRLLMEPDAVLYGMAAIAATPERYAIDYKGRAWV
ncbi:MAG: glucokinase [Alphaproteobacteria bacterium]|nr:glucokinase [Alphaproteobacteria bacterium]